MLRDKIGTARAVRINEVYPSIQGEGLLAGTPSVFIRLQGCNLRCSWCDQPKALERTQNSRDIEGLVEEVLDYSIGHVVITGGEPFFEPNLDILVEKLLAENLSVQIETNGTLWNPGLEPLAEDIHITLSPKATVNFFFQEPFGRFADELKLVVDEELSLEDILRASFLPFLKRGRTVLQPESNRREMLSKALELAHVLSRKGFTLRVIPQIHKLLGMR
jgi:organic radical activating enzyme